MSKLLRIIPNYEPLVSVENDETMQNGIFEWNITSIIDYIAKNAGHIPISEIDVSEYHHKSFSSINEQHIDAFHQGVYAFRLTVR